MADNTNSKFGSDTKTSSTQPNNTYAAPSRAADFLFDIPLELTVEVGRCTMPMGQLLRLMPGSIIELDTPAGEKIGIYANGKLVAKGEAVLLGERYGVRIMEIVGDKQQYVDNSNQGGVL